MIDHERFMALCGSPEASADAMRLATASLMTVGGDTAGLDEQERVAGIVTEISGDRERAAAVLVNLAATVTTLLIAYAETNGTRPAETLRLLALAGQL